MKRVDQNKYVQWNEQRDKPRLRVYYDVVERNAFVSGEAEIRVGFHGEPPLWYLSAAAWLL